MAGRRHHQLLIGLALLLPSLANAQDRARQLFDLGVQSLQAGNPAQAADYFQQSNAINPRASTSCNLGQAYERLGRPCDSQSAYQQCARLDTQGNFRDTAQQRASVLGPQCAQQQRPSPGPAFVPAPRLHPGMVQIVEQGDPRGTLPGPAPDHTLLYGGLVSLGVGAAALLCGALAMNEANNQASWLPEPPATIIAGSEDEMHLNQAQSFTYLGIGLYIGAGIAGALGALLVVLDLAQPGVLGRGSRAGFALTPGGFQLSF